MLCIYRSSGVHTMIPPSTPPSLLTFYIPPLIFSQSSSLCFHGSHTFAFLPHPCSGLRGSSTTQAVLVLPSMMTTWCFATVRQITEIRKTLMHTSLSSQTIQQDTFPPEFEGPSSETGRMFFVGPLIDGFHCTNFSLFVIPNFLALCDMASYL